MNFDQIKENYLLPFKRYFEYEGRSGRPEFWTFVFVNLLVDALLLILLYGSVIFYFIYWAFWLATILPTIMVAIRRLHDTNKSGAFLLIGLIPVIGGIVLLILCAMPGTPAKNRFGDPSYLGQNRAGSSF